MGVYNSQLALILISRNGSLEGTARGAEVVGRPAPSGRHAVSWCLTLVRTGDRTPDTHTHTVAQRSTQRSGGHLEKQMKGVARSRLERHSFSKSGAGRAPDSARAA